MSLLASKRAFVQASGNSSATANVFYNLALAVIYFGSAKLGLSLAFEAAQVTVIWPPTGIALAAVLLLGFRMWPGIALGAFFANIMVDEPVVTALGIAAGNTLEAVAGAWMLRRAGFDNGLSRLQDVLSLIVFSAVLSTMISATIGVTSLILGDVHPWSSYGYLWRLWWLGDAAGALIIAPLLLVWGSGRYRFERKRDMIEAGLLVICSLGFVRYASDITLTYPIFPFIIWAALRFRQHGVTLLTAVTSAAAVWITVHGSGPFSSSSVEHSLMMLQVFMGITSVTGLLLSAAIAESKHTEAVLRDNEEQLAAELKVMNHLYDYSARLAMAPNLQAALNEVLEACITITQADFGNIQMLNSEGTGLEIAVHRGFKQDFLEHFKCVPLRDSTSVCGRAAGTHGRFMIEDVENDPAFAEHLAVARSAGFRAVQSTPLLCRKGSLLGMLSTHFREPRLPSERYLRMLDLYALQAANFIERIRADDALRLADERKDEFLAMLAHELRNPLSPIVAAAETLQQPVTDITRHKDACSIIARQTRHMSRLVDDLLDISRISHGKIELRKEPIALAGAIHNAVEAVRPLVELRKHTLSCELPDEPLWLDADPVRLAQIFANLLGNAAKYTPEGGKLSLSVEANSETIVVKVCDNGIGIPASILSHIFDLFMQADSSLERAQGGLGVGLTLVKKLVEMHGGQVEAASKGENMGSEFTVYLSRAAAPLSIPKQVDSVGTAPRHLRVLVVDDNVNLAKTLGWMLEILGHEAQLAHNAEDAVKTASGYLPDVVMLDIGLPQVNGYELCRQLRAHPNLKQTVFVAQTGWGQAEHRARSKEAGFDYHLVKPVDIALLEKTFLSINIQRAA